MGVYISPRFSFGVQNSNLFYFVVQFMQQVGATYGVSFNTMAMFFFPNFARKVRFSCSFFSKLLLWIFTFTFVSECNIS